MKPPSIRHFDIFYLGGLAVILMGSWINLSNVEHGRLTAAAAKVGALVSLGLYAFIFGALWYMVSVRRTKVAKWIVVVACGIFTFSSLVSVIGPPNAYVDPRSMVAVLIGYLIEALGIWKLFAADARWWLGELDAVPPPPPAYPPPGWGQSSYPPAGYAPPPYAPPAPPYAPPAVPPYPPPP